MPALAMVREVRLAVALDFSGVERQGRSTRRQLGAVHDCLGRKDPAKPLCPSGQPTMVDGFGGVGQRPASR